MIFNRKYGTFGDHQKSIFEPTESLIFLHWLENGLLMGTNRTTFSVGDHVIMPPSKALLAITRHRPDSYDQTTMR